MCFIRQRSVQCDAKLHREAAVGKVHPVPADVELFATLAIPQVEEAEWHRCRIRAELVCGIVLRTDHLEPRSMFRRSVQSPCSGY